MSNTENSIITKGQLAKILNIRTDYLNSASRAGLLKIFGNLISLDDPDTQLYIFNRFKKTPKNKKTPTKKLINEAFKNFGLTKTKIKSLMGEIEKTESKNIQAGKDVKDYKKLKNIEIQERTKKIKADTKLKNIEIEKSEGALVYKDRLGKTCFLYLDLLSKNIFASNNRRADYITDLVVSKGVSAKKEVLDWLDEDIGRLIKKTKTDIEKRIEEWDKIEVSNERAANS